MLPSILLALALQSAPAVALELSAVEPTSIEPYEPAVLELAGSGFSRSCKVLIDMRARFVPVKTEFVDPTRLRAVLAAGLGPEPAARRIVVRCGRQRSSPLSLQIVPVSLPESEPDSTDDPVEPLDPDGEPAAESAQPVAVARLDPAAVPAGEVFTLTLMGSGFSEGATVGVLANANAGTSRAPRYEIVEFEAEFASDSVLILDFDRGFAASPSLRPVVVTNPDGEQSPPVYLEITRGPS